MRAVPAVCVGTGAHSSEFGRGIPPHFIADSDRDSKLRKSDYLSPILAGHCSQQVLVGSLWYRPQNDPVLQPLYHQQQQWRSS